MSPQCSTWPFTVIHTNGIHLVDLSFCACTKAVLHGSWVQQLLWCRLFPMMMLDSQTACTFSLLESSQLLCLQSKLSLYDYYLCIKWLTDATGATDVKVSYFSHRVEYQLKFSKDQYKAFLQTLHMWWHLRMLKHGGRSYDSAGIDGTLLGELAILCLACPIPSVNLPPNWKSIGKNSEHMDLHSESHSFFNWYVPGTSITRHLALTLASASKGDKFQIMRRILSWAPGTHILLHGPHIANTSIISPTKWRFVDPLLSKLPWLMYAMIDEHMQWPCHSWSCQYQVH